MAKDAMAFIDALEFTKVDLFGFSLGGFIAQAIAQDWPDLVRRVILAGTAPAGGEGISNAGALLQDAIAKAGAFAVGPSSQPSLRVLLTRRAPIA
jgi:pimeloyl-ACP methyl ester carboxylesterase